MAFFPCFFSNEPFLVCLNQIKKPPPWLTLPPTYLEPNLAIFENILITEVHILRCSQEILIFQSQHPLNICKSMDRFFRQCIMPKPKPTCRLKTRNYYQSSSIHIGTIQKWRHHFMGRGVPRLWLYDDVGERVTEKWCRQKKDIFFRENIERKKWEPFFIGFFFFKWKTFLFLRKNLKSFL